MVSTDHKLVLEKMRENEIILSEERYRWIMDKYKLEELLKHTNIECDLYNATGL